MTMRETHAKQYGCPCVTIDEPGEGETLPTADELIAYADEIGARHQPEPGEPQFVVQFPGRPQELYTRNAVMRSLKR
jgi:hypothetical protein